MADSLRIAFEELLRKVEREGDVDILREGVRVLSQALMELELRQQLGADRHERTPERTGQRNGYRERRWDTRVGSIELQVPRVRMAASSRRCWNRASGPNARWSPWCRKPTSTASRPVGSTIWCRPWGSWGSARAR